MWVHQMTAAVGYGDAVTNHVLEIDRRLRAWGFETAIYAEHIEPRLVGIAKPDSAYERSLDNTTDLLIYHYSIYNANLKYYARSRNHKIVVYHNITPAAFFRGYDAALEAMCRAGREALPKLRGCDLALGDSDFNRRELVDAGIPPERTDVLPIFLSFDEFDGTERNQALFTKLKANDSVNLLFVGRVAPNKGCEDLIKILYTYRRYLNPRVRLHIIGRRTLPIYARYLDALIAQLGLQDVVFFADRVSLSDLRTYYEACDVFVYPSRHEGFGVPLLESMYFGLPILARNSTAIPETLGTAGVLFSKLACAEIAETLHLLITDTDLRRQIIRRQRQRLADFAPEHVEAKLRSALVRVGAL